MSKASIKDFKNRLQKIDKELYLALEEEKNYFSFRVNLLKSNKQEVLELLNKEGFFPKEVEFYKNAFILPISDRKTIIKSSAYTQNKIYIQNLSSIFAALKLEAKSSDWVLDLAAAPGGKSLIFSEVAKKVSAVEPNKSRFFRMKRNFKEHGAKNIMSFNKDGRFVYKATGAMFDKVFLDAPCSSEAHIDLKKGITWWSLKRIKRFSKLQKELIISAFEALKPGGEMIYATCTFAPEENEETVDFLLKKYDNAKLIEIEHNLKNAKSALLEFEGKKFDDELKKALRIIPNGAFSGFFLAKIKKN